ncbi:ATP-binding cassette domain-containing protein [Nocardia sp. AG03]|uniref:ABC transporter ATP-binding protein n=1 Tax=Nocardia sp. AG03 TaxID=3025312 RepID=UPI0024188230|nr:ATP-binding cassette domain-containing protein [Nocardia sp. AG03]
MIDLRELTVRYAKTTVLDIPALTVPDAAVTYLLGLNGTGKSTLLRCVCGIIAPDTGIVEVDGVRVRAGHITPAGLGMHLDYRAFDPRHTARRHLRWIARSRGLSVARVAEVLARTGLDEIADRRLAQCSLGMLQRVGIAAALLTRPRTLLLDEPLNGLDIAGIHWIRALLRELADAGTCVLVTSHLLDEAERNADRVVVLGAGRVLADAPLPELVRDGDRLEDAYLRITGAAA